MAIEDVANATFDYVIAGGGTAGLVLAARLSEDPEISVAVLEAGKSRLDDPLVDVPALAFQMLNNEDYDWQLYSLPQKGNQNKVHHIPRGKMLGGSSGMNYMIYVRGSDEEYNDWARLTGGETWSADGIRPYMRKHECLDVPPSDFRDSARSLFNAKSHGTSGPIHTSFQDSYLSWDASFMEAARDVTGIAQPEDAWGGKHVGFTNLLGLVARTGPHKGKRSYAARGYLQPNQSRPNLTVLCDTIVSRVILDDDQTAKGVEFIYDGLRHVVQASRETIISCGTIKSPQVLELSGIGDPDIIARTGIECIVPLPRVGANLQDHLFTGAAYELMPGVHSMDELSDPEKLKAAQEQYQKTKDGPLTSLASSAGFYSGKTFASENELRDVVQSIRATQAEPSCSHFYRKQLDALISRIEDPTGSLLHLGSIPASVDLDNLVQNQARLAKGAGIKRERDRMLISVSLQHCASRGTIHIEDKDPRAQPAIDLGYLTHPADVNLLATAHRIQDKLVDASALAGTIHSRYKPAPSVDLSDLEQAKGWIQEWCMGQYHPVGTCAMGDVLDSRLRVKGVKALRVCDASVFPNHVSGNITSTVYAVAEKAADMIKADRTRVLNEGGPCTNGKQRRA